MELRQLRHFATLAQEMHFGRAAKHLNMTQPALSASLMRLEEEFGLRLLERDSRHVTLTFAGEAMLARAKEMIELADRTRDFAHALSTGRAGRIEVGFTASLLYRGLADILTRFSTGFPQVELSVREFPTQRQFEMVWARRLDAGFVNTPVPPAGLQHLVLFEDRFVACLPSQHALAGESMIDLALLRDESFIMFAREPSPAYYDHVLGMCAEAGFQPRIGLEAGQVLSVVALVASGLGVSLVPESVSKAGIAGAKYVPVKGALVQPSAYLIWNEDVSTPGLSALISTVRAVREAAGHPSIELVNRPK